MVQIASLLNKLNLSMGYGGPYPIRRNFKLRQELRRSAVFAQPAVIAASSLQPSACKCA